LLSIKGFVLLPLIFAIVQPESRREKHANTIHRFLMEYLRANGNPVAGMAAQGKEPPLVIEQGYR
jgi:hypothetical protein